MLVDVHAHLTSKQFSEDLDEVINRCKSKGVVKIVANGLGFESNLKILEIIKKYKMIDGALGLHPVNVLKEDLDRNVELIIKNKSKIKAIGEIGLDFFKNEKEKGFPFQTQEKKKQFEVFKKMVELSGKLKKVVIVHSRGSEEKVFDVLSDYSLKKVVMHYYTGDLKLGKKIESRGWYFSVPGTILFSKDMQELVREVSLGNLLTETDCPFLNTSGNRDEPWFVLEVVKKISSIKKMDVKEIEDAIYENYKNLFKPF